MFQTIKHQVQTLSISHLRQKKKYQANKDRDQK